MPIDYLLTYGFTMVWGLRFRSGAFAITQEGQVLEVVWYDRITGLDVFREYVLKHWRQIHP